MTGNQSKTKCAAHALAWVLGIGFVLGSAPQAQAVGFWLSDGTYLYHLQGHGDTWAAERAARPFHADDAELVNVNGLAVAPNGWMFGTAETVDGGGDPVTYLFRVNKGTGAGAKRKLISGATRVSQLGFHGDGTLYGIDTVDDVLVTIDLETAVATPVGTGLNAGMDIVGGDLAIPNGLDANTIYSFNEGQGSANVLFAIDRHTGLATVVGETRPRLRRVVGAAFTRTNFLYGIANKEAGPLVTNIDDHLFKVLRPLVDPLVSRDLGTIPTTAADTTDLGNYESLTGDMASRVFPDPTTPPVLVATDPPQGFIDPLGIGEATGTGIPRISKITMVFDQVVFGWGGEWPTADDFGVASTNGNPQYHVPGDKKPKIDFVDASANPVIVVHLTGPIHVAEWFRVTAFIENAIGHETIATVRVAHLPLDQDQDEVVTISDVSEFGIQFRMIPQPLEFLDVNRDGVISASDPSDWGLLWRDSGSRRGFAGVILPPVP